MTTAIHIEGLGKSYVIRHEQGDRYLTLRDTLTDAAKGLGRRLLNPLASREARSSKEVFWALRDVNIEIKEGERVGVIGRNGAGKSTMLKLLSRITEPSEGRIAIRGRVSSLLEVGTGFHPELTGRENIFLNGTILGMTSQEIRRKFDEIVAFAEIERFLDTPVKRYSSGMYVRLAFGVAAHLEPDILIVDEVLAVGDAQFQRRCLGRMRELSGDGRTVIFVTHNMDALVTLCDRGLVLDRGSVAYAGSAQAARDHYMESMSAIKYSTSSHSGRGGSGGATIHDVWLEDGAGNRVGATTRTRSMAICMDVEVDGNLIDRDDVDFAVGIDTEDGRRLHTVMSSWSGRPVRATSYRTAIVCDFPDMPLVPGRYLVSASVIFHGDTLDSIQHCTAFDVVPSASTTHADRRREFGPLDLRCSFRERSLEAAREDARRGGPQL